MASLRFNTPISAPAAMHGPSAVPPALWSDLLEMKRDASKMMALGLSQEDVAKVNAMQLHFVSSRAAVSSSTVTGCGQGPHGQYTGATCDKNIMYTGRHYAEFWHNGGNSPSHLHCGVVDPSYSCGQAANQTASGTWMIQYQSGQLRVCNQNVQWAGQQQVQAQQGSQLGLLLDLDEGGLAVYKNGKSLGWAVPPGSLVGPLRWNADIYCYNQQAPQNGCGARIEAKPTPK